MAKVVYRELFNNLEFFNTRLSFSQKSKLLRELNAKQKVAFYLVGLKGSLIMGVIGSSVLFVANLALLASKSSCPYSSMTGETILDYFCDGRRLLTMQELPTRAFVNTLSFVILIMILNSVYFALLTLNGKSTK